MFKLNLNVLQLLDLKVQLVNGEIQLSDFLILLGVVVLESLDVSQEFFNASLESVDFNFLLTSTDFNDAQLRNELVLLEQLVSQVFNGALLHEQVLLEIGDLALERLDFSAFTDQMFEFSGGQNEADSVVFVLNLQGLDLSITLGKNNLEFVETEGEFLELSEETFTFLEEHLVLVFDGFLSTLDTFEFLGAAQLVHFEFVLDAVEFIVVFNVDDLLDLLRGCTSEFNEFFGEGLVVGFQNLNALSENVEFLSVAGFNLHDLLDVDGVLGGRLGDEDWGVVTLDGGDVDDVAAILRAADRRFTAVDEGLLLTRRRVLSVLDDLADDISGTRDGKGVLSGALFDESAVLALLERLRGGHFDMCERN